MVVVLAAVTEVCGRFGFVALDWITAGVSPVFVLTRGPRLILVLTVIVGPDMAELGPKLNLLFDLTLTV